MKREEDLQRLFRLALVVVAAITIVRVAVLVVSPLELYPDEAQYWWWAQTPDVGYFSKPPFIAWLIRASTLLFGDREWAIRLPIPLLHAATALITFAIAGKVRPERPSIAFWCALAYLTLPGVSYSSGLASTDAPLLFFWSLALLAFLSALGDSAWRWPLLCGAALGLGMLAKYAMGFFLVGAVAAAFLNTDIRRLVVSRRGLVAVCLAALVIAPNIAWNASHAFVTVSHVNSNADWSRAKFSLPLLAGFLAGQFGVFGPVLMAAWAVAVWRRRRLGLEGAADAVLCSMSLVPLALIAVQAFVADANANWAATAYVAALPLAVEQVLDRWPRITLWIAGFLHGTILVLLWVVLVRPPVADRLGLGNVFKRQEGWRELAGDVSTEFSRGSYDLIASENRSITAEMLYYLRPKSASIRIWDPDQANHNHFEMTMRLEAGAGHVLLVLMPEDVDEVVATFESARPIATVSTPARGRHKRDVCLYDGRSYRGPTNPE